MKRVLSFLLCLCLMLPGMALAQTLEGVLQKGEDFIAAGDLSSAAICYDLALKADPENVQALAGLARLTALKGDINGGLAILEEALLKEPLNGELYLVKASLLESANRHEEAETALQYALICGAQPKAPAAKKDAALADAVTGHTARLTPATPPAGLSDQWVPVSVSPSGKAAIYLSDDGLAVVREGRVMPLSPNYAKRGEVTKEQQYTLERHPQFGRWVEQDSIVWSPDETYFALTFPNRVLRQMRFYDLIIGDTRTGEIYLAEATPTKMMQEGATAAITACFDPEGKYVYYLVYGYGLGDSPSALKRYELATGKAERLVCRYDLFMYQPRLYVFKDGTIKVVSDHSKHAFIPGVLTFREEGGEWTVEEAKVSQPLSIQRLQRYLYSENSGHELILCCMPGNNPAYFYLTLNGDALMLPKGGNVCVKLPVSADLAKGNYHQVINAELSPDGHFALAATAEHDLYLIDLETLTFAPVTLPGKLSAPQAGREGGLFNWNADGSVLLNLDKQNTLLNWE